MRRPRPLHLLLGAALCLTPVGLFAGGAAWGEWEPEQFQRLVGFIPVGIRNAANLPAPLAGYQVPGVGPGIGYLLSGAAGVALLLAAMRLLRRRG